MASGDTVYERTNMSVTGRAAGDKSEWSGFAVTGFVNSSGKAFIGEYGNVLSFDPTKTYDIIVKEH